MINSSCDDCLELQNKWYRTLYKSFNDIESLTYEDRPLKSWHSYIFQHLKQIDFDEKYDYNDRANELLRRFEFKSEIQKKIWELHCEGLSSPEIEKRIKSLKNAKKQLTIRNIIKELEREFV